jgi:cobalt-zinc-cadmium resistance protein CzcA
MRLPRGYNGAVCESIWKAPQQAADRRASDILLVFMLLFAALHSARLAAMVFTGVPFAVTGGILAMFWRAMPFFDERWYRFHRGMQRCMF